MMKRWVKCTVLFFETVNLPAQEIITEGLKCTETAEWHSRADNYLVT